MGVRNDDSYDVQEGKVARVPTHEGKEEISRVGEVKVSTQLLHETLLLVVEVPS